MAENLGIFSNRLVISPLILCFIVPTGSPSHSGDVTAYVRHKPTELAYSFLFCSCVYFSVYGPFTCIIVLLLVLLLFHSMNSPDNSPFSDSGLISALMVLSTIYLLMKVSFSPDMIHSD